MRADAKADAELWSTMAPLLAALPLIGLLGMVPGLVVTIMLGVGIRVALMISATNPPRELDHDLALARCQARLGTSAVPQGRAYRLAEMLALAEEDRQAATSLQSDEDADTVVALPLAGATTTEASGAEDAGLSQVG